MLRLFSEMGWGLSDSSDHYLDFVSAVLAVAILFGMSVGIALLLV